MATLSRASVPDSLIVNDMIGWSSWKLFYINIYGKHEQEEHDAIMHMKKKKLEIRTWCNNVRNMFVDIQNIFQDTSTQVVLYPIRYDK